MTTPTILHVDMDAFFASVEQRDDPALRGKCVVVGGSHRGVVAAASYEARKFGIHSAMPIFQARQRCAQLVIVAPKKGRYSSVSRQIMAILNDYSPLVEPLSIDEAFVDITGCGRLYGTPRETARRIKQRIQHETELTCSVGIAPCKFLAKIASDMDKPDGLTEITPGQAAEFVRMLPAEKVPGVGRRAQAILAGLGIRTLGDVQAFDPALLVRRLGKFGHRLIKLAQGRDDRPVTPDSEVKSVSSELTLAENTKDTTVLAAHLLAQAETVARQLRRDGVQARTIYLKLKTANFQQFTRCHTLARPVRSSEAIYRTALSLLNAFSLNQPVRLVGLGAGNLLSASHPVQQSLFGDALQTPPDHPRWEKVDRAVDAIADRYGASTVIRGTLSGRHKHNKPSGDAG
ncbi:MAG: DNA polymerase IV [Desulfatitalea sp.]|nr:DNA polymerase IV [Desulfatitalea sp.]NNK01216.1 DNA polymerase IV [Desulfatitalea sp.]